MAVYAADRARLVQSPKGLSLHILDDAAEPLRVEKKDGDLRLHVSSRGLDADCLNQWVDRLGALAGSSAFDNLAIHLSGEANIVCVDPHISHLASAYGDALGLKVTACTQADEIGDLMCRLPRRSTMTILLLANRLDEQLCHALFEGNRRRGAAGLDRLAYGFLCAGSAPSLAWLLAKTLAMLAVSPLRRATFALWDFDDTVPSAQHVTPGASPIPANISDPWTNNKVELLCARAHGASFDVSLGETILCGRVDGVPAHGPSCFYDGVCFRVDGEGSAARQRLVAHRATPLIWCLDSCASVPFEANAFGTSSSYVYGLLAGAASAIICPYLDIPTRGGLIEEVQDELARGATLGEAAALACAYDPAEGFDRFLLLGSPDIALLPRTETRRASNRILAPRFESGAPGQAAMTGETVRRSRAVGPTRSQEAWERLAARARRIIVNLELLPFYPLEVEAGAIRRCMSDAKEHEHILATAESPASWTDVAVSLARLEVSLDQLHQEAAGGFLRRVASEDISLDRLPAVGFTVGPTRRTEQVCPRCDAALYETRSECLRIGGVARTWLQCPNCGGISLTRDDAPFRASLGVRSLGRSSLKFELGLSNRSQMAIDVVLAAAPRRGGPGTVSLPRACRLAPGEQAAETFGLNKLTPGVVSYRVIALCDGAVDLFACRQPILPCQVKSRSGA